MNNSIACAAGIASFLGSIFLAACSQSRPLSISLVNPITREFRTCAAREAPTAKNTEALANTVELCAKQLEGRGYVRED